MGATLMYGAGDVRVENVPDPVLQEPTDAIVRVVRTCICGSDLHPYHNMPASEQGTPMGHEFLGVVEERGAQVTGLKKGDLVVASFAFQDNTCDFCREGVRPSRSWSVPDRSRLARARLRTPQGAAGAASQPAHESPAVRTAKEMLMSGWTSDELATIGQAEELELASQRHDAACAIR